MVFAILFLLMSPSWAVSETRVSLAAGGASVVFPVGQPLKVELSPSDAAQLRQLESRGHMVDRSADLYEVRVDGEWFVASVTLFEGSGVLPPNTCPKTRPPETAAVVRDWGCRELRSPGVPGMEVRYTNAVGEALRIRSHYRDGKLYMLLYSRDAVDREPTGAGDQADAFFSSFQLANP